MLAPVFVIQKTLEKSLMCFSKYFSYYFVYISNDIRLERKQPWKQFLERTLGIFHWYDHYIWHFMKGSG